VASFIHLRDRRLYPPSTPSWLVTLGSSYISQHNLIVKRRRLLLHRQHTHFLYYEGFKHLLPQQYRIHSYWEERFATLGQRLSFPAPLLATKDSRGARYFDGSSSLQQHLHLCRRMVAAVLAIYPLAQAFRYQLTLLPCHDHSMAFRYEQDPPTTHRRGSELFCARC